MNGNHIKSLTSVPKALSRLVLYKSEIVRFFKNEKCVEYFYWRTERQSREFDIVVGKTYIRVKW